MKRFLHHISLLLAFWFVANVAWGQDVIEISGIWENGFELQKDKIYRLKAYTVLRGQLSVASGTATLDLNGYTLDRNKNGFVAVVGSQKTLVIKDSKGDGKITGGRGDRGGCMLISGIVRLEGGEITDCIATDGDYTSDTGIHSVTQGCGGAFFVNQDAKLIMSGGKITNCSTEKTNDATFGRGGAVFVDAEEGHDGGIFEMTGGAIFGCGASFGGAVYIHQSQNTTGEKVSGTFTMSGGVIKETTSNNGGGVYIAPEGQFTMSGGEINGTTSTLNGGGVYVEAAGVFDMSGGTLQNCKSGAHGCGIYTVGIVNISKSAMIKNNRPNSWPDVTFIDNKYPKVQSTSQYYGGALYATGTSAVVSMSGGTMESNQAASGGAVMLWAGSEMTMTGGTMDGNYAIGQGGLGNGGAVYIQTATFNFYGGTLSNNTANRYGGAINLNQSAELNLNGNCNITGNKASHGGGISQEQGKCILKLSGSGININNNEAHGHQVSFSDGTYSVADAKGNGGGLFIEKGTVTIEGATISNNIASGHGGGASLYVHRIHGRQSTINIKGGLISNNTAEYGGGIDLYADFPSTTDNHDKQDPYEGKSELTVNFESGTLQDNKATNGAGIYVGFNEEFSTATMTIGTANSTPVISGNIATENGGGFGMTNDGTITVNNISASGNKAQNGGAIWLGSGKFTVTNGSFQSNEATVSGGAIYMGDGTFNVTSASFDSNTATASGGGICIDNGTFTIKDGTFQSNTTTTSGGGIYMGNGTFTLTGTATMDGNSANQGGAINIGEGSFIVKGAAKLNNNSAKSGDGGAVWLSGGTSGKLEVISGASVIIGTEGANTATGNGGGVYCAGTFLVNSGATATIENNNAANGGGVCVNNGSVKLPVGDGSKIQNNTATQLGGGLYVVNTTSTQTEATFNGGTFIGNTAKSGGAVCASGNMALTLAATMVNNTATNGNGGGIYMVEGVKMTFGNGLIRANKAEGALVSSGGTALEKDATTVQGVGGGIFMGKDCTLTFNSTEMGIYNNSATNAGADICANGTNTSITLPNISKMNLKGFDVPGNMLYWVEDYFTGETYGDDEREGIRYEDALIQPQGVDQKYILPYEDGETSKTITRYLCLDLGYDLVFVTVNVQGLDLGDDAIVTMSYPEKNANGDLTGKSVQYRNVLFTQKTSASSTIVKTVGLPSGDWKFDATGWTYKYNSPSFAPTHTNGYISIVRGGITEVSITFAKINNDQKQNVKEYMHRIVNRMGTSTTTTNL